MGLGGCDIGVSYTLPRIVGAGQAFDLILTARTVDAAEALALGLVSRLSAGSVVEDALALAETLCGYGKFGVESTKQVLWANLEAPSLDAALQVENRSQILASTGGASDANTTSGMGVPSIDGLGPIGGMDHSPEEYLEVGSIVPRTALVAALLLEVARDPMVASWRAG